MGFDRRQVLAAAGLALFGGCLEEDRLEESVGLRVRNDSAEPRRLEVLVERVGEERIYEEEHRLASGDAASVEELATAAGRYRVTATDLTDEEEEETTDAQLDAELDTGEPFCGWFVVIAEDEGSMAVSLPRCFEEDENEGGETNESNGSSE